MEKTQITNIKNEVMDIITNPVAIKKRILQTTSYSKIYDLEEMDQYVENHRLPRVGRIMDPQNVNILISGKL